jgi:hypothetical protein
MNGKLIPFPARECKGGEAENREARQPVKIEFELPAPLADQLVIQAGYAMKSPGQWARDALTAVLQMGGVG